MTREQVKKMMDEVIKTFGFEDARTVKFCELCECYLDGFIMTCDFEIEVDDFYFCEMQAC